MKKRNGGNLNTLVGKVERRKILEVAEVVQQKGKETERRIGRKVERRKG